MAEQSMKTHTKIRWILSAFLFLGVVFAVTFGCWYFFNRDLVSSNDARIQADTVDLSSQIAGRLIAVHVAEGDTVRRGQIMFEMDTAMLVANLEKAENDLATARKSLSIAEAQYQKALNGPRPEEIRLAQNGLESAAQKRTLAETEWKRVDTLYQSNAVPQSAWEQAKGVFDLARFEYDRAQENLRLVQAGTREDDKLIARTNVDLSTAQIASMESVVRQAQISLEYATVAAPYDGIVVRIWREPGSVITPGTPVVTAFDLGSLFVSANIEEKNLYKIERGDQVTMTIDAYPGYRLTGSIDQILPAANSEFSLIPSSGVSGNFIKVSQRIELRIRLDQSDGLRALRLGPGMSVVVHIATEHAKRKS